jgi:hypothetical protein
MPFIVVAFVVIFALLEETVSGRPLRLSFRFLTGSCDDEFPSKALEDLTSRRKTFLGQSCFGVEGSCGSNACGDDGRGGSSGDLSFTPAACRTSSIGACPFEDCILCAYVQINLFCHCYLQNPEIRIKRHHSPRPENEFPTQLPNIPSFLPNRHADFKCSYNDHSDTTHQPMLDISSALFSFLVRQATDTRVSFLPQTIIVPFLLSASKERESLKGNSLGDCAESPETPFPSSPYPITYKLPVKDRCTLGTAS